MLRNAVSCLLLLLLIAPVHGAEPESETGAAGETGAASAEPASEPEVDPEDIDAVLAEEIRAAEEAASNAAPADSDESFVPSVQISEDLSVSFPVDI